MVSSNTLCVIGLGKLGAPVAACYAAKGHRVTGVDSNLQTLDLLRRKQSPNFEPDLAEMLYAAQDRLRLSDNVAQAVRESEFVFILVPTPSESDGSFSLRFVRAVCEQVAQGLRHHEGYPVIVISSTVMPGATQGELLPLLEQQSERTCGRDFGLCYNPEFVALGSVLRDMLSPDFILIGESDPRAGELLANFLLSVCDNKPPIARLNIINAEVAKIAVNTFVTTKISFANFLARVCERLPGGNVDEVSSALGLDSRIGKKYLRGAIGYGGPCFPRDNLAISRLSHLLDIEPFLPEATDIANRHEVNTLANLIGRYLPEGGTAGILGLSYKENTDVIDESQGILVAEELTRRDVPVVVYDPCSMPLARLKLPATVQFSSSALDCLQASDVCIVATPWPEFTTLDVSALTANSKTRLIIDCWRFLPIDLNQNNPSIQIVRLGEELPAGNRTST